MRSGWGVWGRLAFALIWVDAILLALDQALRRVPALAQPLNPLLGSSVWHYTPLVVISAALAILIARKAVPRKAGMRHTPTNVALNRLQNRTFRDASVLIDGNEYVNCTFQNCTILYEGGAYSLVDCSFESGCRIGSNNAIAKGAIGLSMTLARFGSSSRLVTIKPPEPREKAAR